MHNNTFQEIQIPNNFNHAKKTEELIVSLAVKGGYGEDDLFSLRVGLEEALSNAIRHGNNNDPSKNINVRFTVNNQRIEIYIADEGNGFDPLDLPDPTRQENLEIPSGRGVMLMRVYMNLVEYNQIGNAVHMVKIKNENPNSL